MPAPGDTALLVDAMLGTLATHLRMCGYDAASTLQRGVEADDAILAVARAEDRTLLTRDADLAARAEDSVLVSSKHLEEQLRELRAAGFELALTEPSRCSRCNGRLEPVADGEPTPGYAPSPADEPVWRCPDCGQHYWRGSHWDDVAEKLASL